jgi:uncharacterized protein (TIGR00369 family)
MSQTTTTSETQAALAAALQAANAASPFNGFAGFEIVAVAPGEATLAAAAAPALTNHAGLLHAGVQSALIDTACGYAAAGVAGNVTTVQLSLSFLAAAKGERFEARARVIRAGRSQIFAEARLFALRDGVETLAASGTAVLVRIA